MVVFFPLHPRYSLITCHHKTLSASLYRGIAMNIAGRWGLVTNSTTTYSTAGINGAWHRRTVGKRVRKYIYIGLNIYIGDIFRRKRWYQCLFVSFRRRFFVC